MRNSVSYIVNRASIEGEQQLQAVYKGIENLILPRKLNQTYVYIGHFFPSPLITTYGESTIITEAIKGQFSQEKRRQADKPEKNYGIEERYLEREDDCGVWN